MIEKAAQIAQDEAVPISDLRGLPSTGEKWFVSLPRGLYIRPSEEPVD